MRKFILLFNTSLFLFSCSGDDGLTSDFLSYDDGIYSISDGLYVDFGTDSSDYQLHYNYDLFLTDGEAFTHESGRSFKNPTYIFYVELFSSGAETFDGGQFAFIESESVTVDNVEGINWFSMVLLSTDASYRPISEGIKTGTIDVQKDGDLFVLDIDLELMDDSSLSAKYNGTLQRSIYLQKVD